MLSIILISSSVNIERVEKCGVCVGEELMWCGLFGA